MRSPRPTLPGLTPAKPQVSATGTPAACAQMVDTHSSQLTPPSAPPDASAPTPAHPSLTALARLLARQISRSGA